MKVGLFVTCLVDLMRPRIGFAALRLLEAAGCEVVVPASQTCCGQPAWNSGVLGDLGCMLNIEGKLRRMGDEKTSVLHTAEILVATEKQATDSTGEHGSNINPCRSVKSVAGG